MHVTFPAIGTSVFLAVRDRRDLAAAERLARQVLADVDATCSRFRDDSDLTRVNRQPGRWVAVDPLLVAAVEIAVAAARRTDGVVHPLLGRTLVQLGYDRDFDLLREYDDHPVPVTPPPLDSWREIRIDPAGGLRIPEDTALDLGATGKAWCADLIATAYERHLRGSAVVSVGGDVRVARPDGRPWLVGVSEHPGRAGRGDDRRRGRRGRHVDDAGPPLDPQRRTSAPPARPPHRTARAGGLADGDRGGADLRGGQHREHRRDRARRGGPRLALDGIGSGPAGASRRTGPAPRRLAGRGGGGMSEGPLLWYLNRATGLTLLVLLTASVVLGVLSTGGRAGRGLPAFVTQHLHRNVALLSVVALVVHVLTAVGDTFVDIRWWHALQPFGAEYEPLWLGLGALSLDLIAVVAITSALRTRLSHRVWRSVHYASWAAWVCALAHTLGIGTDIDQGRLWAVVPTAACVLAVCLAAGLRLGRSVPTPPQLPARRTS